jgi:cytidylate kinase
MAISSDRVVESLAHLNRYLDTKASHDREGQAPLKKEGARPITIAVSRQAGSRGAEIARAVGARLGWHVYDHELLDRIGEERGLSRRLLERLDERYISWLEDAAHAFCGDDTSRDSAYLRGLLGLLASLGKVGHCVIVGRGAAQVLPPETTLSVRVVAPRAIRVAEVRHRKGLSAVEAERWVDHTDRERTLFVKSHFHIDADDPLHYDLVLNSRRLSAEACAAVIVESARALEEHLAGKGATTLAASEVR